MERMKKEKCSQQIGAQWRPFITDVAEDKVVPFVL
jgi:hypothetical protein